MLFKNTKRIMQLENEINNLTKKVDDHIIQSTCKHPPIEIEEDNSFSTYVGARVFRCRVCGKMVYGPCGFKEAREYQKKLNKEIALEYKKYLDEEEGENNENRNG